MVVDFSRIDLREQPVLILKNASGVPIGTLGSALNIRADIKYNEASVLEFNLPAQVDGKDTPYYKSVVGMRIVDLQDIGQFILMNPKETGDGVKKTKACKAYSLEYEFTFKKVTLENATYNFWNPVTPDSTLLGILLELMPSWSVGSVDSALVGKYRTFEVSDENVYNFIKGTVQQSYNCIFDFDTYARKINVRDASSAVATNPIYISNANLAKEITVEENTEEIVTRLDVNGAEGVNIRDVNPAGTNQIVNLDYFMTTDNFDGALINKYYAWKKSYEDYQLPYYNLSIEYSLQVMRKATEGAALVELQGELTSLENQQAVIIQSIGRGLDTQKSLDNINATIKAKQAEIKAKQKEIDSIDAQAQSIFKQLADINRLVKFETYFTSAEFLALNRYIKDDALSESSFVAEETCSYTDDDIGNPLTNAAFSVSGAKITYVTNSSGKDIYDIKGGSLSCGFTGGEIIRAAFERSSDNSFVMTAYLGNGTTADRKYPTACLSLTGTVSSVKDDLKVETDMPEMKTGTSLSLTVKSGYLYFTLNTSEYEKRAVAWELFEYGNEILKKISQPSYKFSVSTANFLCLEDFENFKNRLRHGEKLYIGISEDETLAPICTGAKFNYDAINELELEFSDTYTSGDSSFLLADLLEQSVSMGKSVDLSKFSYSAFIDSGANTKVRDFMTTALDVAKNAIISSREQAITWGDSGIRLRKWTSDAHDAYEPQEVWMNNNSILMTNNNWSTAEIAIGQFRDANLGDCWGIVAPNIVGTLLAGNNLVIESAKKDGGVAVFKVDAEGCVLHNSTLSVTNDKISSHILLDPDHGFMIGKYPLTTIDGKIDDSKKLFFADTKGNLTLKGTIYASDGEFTGKITALSGYIGQPSAGWAIGSTYIYNAKPSFSSTAEGIYIGTDGFSLGNATSYIRGNRNGYLLANNVSLTGNITAKSGNIGGCEIQNGVLKVGNANITSLNASKITAGTMSADRISGGTIDATNVTIKNLNASNITSGSINANNIAITNLNASNITTGTLNCSNITVKNLRADSITVGQLTASQISGLPASQITSGQFATTRIPELNCSKITSGTFDPVRIPNLSCSKITSGTLDPVRIPNLSADKITSGSLSANRISGGTLSGCSISIGSAFYVSSTGYVRMNIDTFNVYSSDDRRYHSGQTFDMTVVRNVTAAVVVSKIVLRFVQGICTGWFSG